MGDQRLCVKMNRSKVEITEPINAVTDNRPYLVNAKAIRNGVGTILEWE